MTDKQAIDVTRCIHFDKSDIPNGCTCYWDSECNHDCYYKQLKRKEQECDELKEKNKLLMIKATDGISKRDWAYEQRKKKYDQLKAENENLKKQVCGLRPELKSIIVETCCKYNIEAKYYHEKIVKIINKLDEYKQTLAEIKEIMEKHCRKCKKHKFYHIQLCCTCKYINILQKISEVENENK